MKVELVKSKKAKVVLAAKKRPPAKKGQGPKAFVLKKSKPGLVGGKDFVLIRIDWRGQSKEELKVQLKERLKSFEDCYKCFAYTPFEFRTLVFNVTRPKGGKSLVEECARSFPWKKEELLEGGRGCYRSSFGYSDRKSFELPVD